ncbi:GNAT family N-acetyltransferase [Microterricola viridarii]|uniref:GNAT family N-acetyltransferase n=1 Tax=Microterricola viridarii TaxID=412690 RepID=UPI000A91DF58|nr:GNAT family N-acetyltransferase [Microterricola viridarii]
MLIRPAQTADLARLAEIEAAAGERFRTLGMSAIADDAPPSPDEYESFRAAGRAWVAVDDGTEIVGTAVVGTAVVGTAVVGYLLARLVDGNAHIEQVSVHPDSARRGIGAALIEAVEEWAHGHGLAALTLTTFADVPWNAPYYARLGFVELAVSEWGLELTALVGAEEAHGLTRWPRVVMHRPLATGDDPPERDQAKHRSRAGRPSLQSPQRP